MNILRRLEALEEEISPPPTMQVIATIHIVSGRRDGADPYKFKTDPVERERIVIKGEPFVPVDWSRRSRYSRRRGRR